MKFFHPRPLYPVEVFTVIVASVLFLVASYLTDRNGWFSITTSFLQMYLMLWLMCCTIAAVRLRSAWERFFWTEQVIVSRVNLRLMELSEHPTEADRAEFERLTAEGRASLERQRAALESWGKFP